MLFFTENEIDRLIEDDVPAGDMTTLLLDLQGKEGTIRLYARDEMIVCCTEEAVRMYQKAGLEVNYFAVSGTNVKTGDTIITASGNADAIHLIWRTGSAMIEYASGISGRTRQLVNAARKDNPSVAVAGTRKHPPYVKKIALKALITGGGVPHRTGLSDTILLFREHLLFTGGYEKLPEVLQSIKLKQKERKIVVEAHSVDEALTAVRSGAHAVQLDKLPLDSFSICADQCHALNPEICVIAAGGINHSNAAAYSKAGADVLVTSWMYYSPPADIGAEIVPLSLQ